MDEAISRLSPPTEPLAVAIASKSERQVMEWGLVLVSQGIETVIEHAESLGSVSGTRRVWCLKVAGDRVEGAREAIRLYRRENRRIKWTHEEPTSGVLFHNGAVLWSVAMGCIFLSQTVLLESGIFDSRSVRTGAWWRALTATWLHADIAHLAANTLAGGVMMGLAMGRFGPGTALLLTLIGGMCGNLFALLVRGVEYRGLGASGVVMAALGLLAGQAVTGWPVNRSATRWLVTRLGGGVFLFLIIGVNPRADVLAHFGGFLSGLGLGAIGALLSWNRWDSQLGMAYVTLVIVAWGQALLRVQ